jgi:hypothetical protein
VGGRLPHGSPHLGELTLEIALHRTSLAAILSPELVTAREPEGGVVYSRRPKAASASRGSDRNTSSSSPISCSNCSGCRMCRRRSTL